MNNKLNPHPRTSVKHDNQLQTTPKPDLIPDFHHQWQWQPINDPPKWVQLRRTRFPQSQTDSTHLQYCKPWIFWKHTQVSSNVQNLFVTDRVVRVRTHLLNFYKFVKEFHPFKFHWLENFGGEEENSKFMWVGWWEKSILSSNFEFPFREFPKITLVKQNPTSSEWEIHLHLVSL